jgi:hypothetical protein
MKLLTIIFLALATFFGFKFLTPPQKRSGDTGTEYRKRVLDL